jgi:hypothetical protein
MQNETHHAERQAMLSGLDAEIDRLDSTITSPVAERKTLERARRYILSRNNTTTSGTEDDIAQTASAPNPHMKPTYPSPSLPARKAPSGLRQQVLIRNAMERGNSLSPPCSAGLLSSDEFETAFRDDSFNSSGNGEGGNQNIKTSVEYAPCSAAENHSASSSTTTTTTTETVSHDKTLPVSETTPLDPPMRSGQGAHRQAKRATKRRLQDNAAKARDARRRKLDEANSTTTGH